MWACLRPLSCALRLLKTVGFLLGDGDHNETL